MITPTKSNFNKGNFYVNFLCLCPLCSKHILVIESITYQDGKIILTYSCYCQKGKHSISISEYLSLLVNKTPILPKCELHNSTNALHYCKNCKGYMCTKCVTYHSDFRKDHIVKFAYELKEGCIKHKLKEFSYYCSQCRRFICDECGVTCNKENHKLFSISQVYVEVGKSLKLGSYKELGYYADLREKEWKAGLQKHINTINDLIQRLKETKKNIINRYNEIMKENDNLFFFYTMVFSNFLESKGSDKTSVIKNMKKLGNVFVRDEKIDNEEFHNDVDKILNDIEGYEKHVIEGMDSIFWIKVDKSESKQKTSSLEKENTQNVNADLNESATTFLGQKKKNSSSLELESVKNNMNFYTDMKSHRSSVNHLVKKTYNVNAVNLEPEYLKSKFSCCKQLIQIDNHVPRTISLLNLSEKKSYIVTSSKENQIYFYNLTTNKIDKSVKVNFPMVNLIGNKLVNHSFVILSTEDNSIYLLNFLDLTEQNNLVFKGHTNEITSIQVFEGIGGKKFLSSSLDMTVCLWDSVCCEKPLSVFKDPAMITVMNIVLSNDGFCTGGSDGTIRLWKITSEAPSNELKGHNNSIVSLSLNAQWNSGKKLISSSSVDRTIRIWDCSDENQVKCAYVYNEIGKVIQTVLWCDKILLFCYDNVIAALSYDEEEKAYKCINRRETQHKSEILKLGLFQNEKKLISFGSDNSYFIWE